MGQGKIPWYTHRLMHRKRVTCELHESYFHLMTIKHAIPKIEWAIELLYNSVYTGSQWVGDQMSWREDELERRCGRESHHPAERGPWDPRLSFGDQLVRRCWNENMFQGSWAPRPPVEQSRRTRTTHGYVQRGWGVQYVAVFVQSPTPSHTQPFK